MKNSLFLKKYVQMHPDNKMGWYLLGKEYEKKGEIGKANYCFNQAGKVYEAFEHSKIPDELWEDYQSRLLLEEQAKEKKVRQTRRILVTIMILLLMLLPSLYAPGNEQPLAEGSDVPVSVPQGESQPSKQVEAEDSSKPEAAPRPSEPRYTAHRISSEQDRMKLLSHVFKASSQDYEWVAVLGLRPAGDWLLWKHDMPVVYSLMKNDTGGTLMQSYLQEECHCEPPESTLLQKSSSEWVQDQEERAVLLSAIAAYRNRTGTLPQVLEDLTQPFPNNILSGSSKGLQAKLKAVKESAGKRQESSFPASAGGVDTLGALDLGGAGLLSQPLKVIVDKQNYRLAVVSGSVLIRNYRVGLGGDLTPEGEFVITDKVVNPNGRSDGEFGSRGMQLSDTNYAIHGTNDPSSIERDESLGCIRMDKEDVEELFDLIPMGTKVSIVKGLLPDTLLAPEERFQLKLAEAQGNPHKTYHWLN